MCLEHGCDQHPTERRHYAVHHGSGHTLPEHDFLDVVLAAEIGAQPKERVQLGDVISLGHAHDVLDGHEESARRK